MNAVKKSWYKVVKASAGDLAKCQADDSTDLTVIDIFDEIGSYGITAKDFINRLNNISTAKVLLRINSPGGSVLDGLAIYNAIRQHRSEFFANVLGYAASMASIIALSVESPAHLFMSENSYLMFHRPTMGGMNSDEVKSYLEDAQVWFDNYVPQVESDIELLKSMEDMFIRMYSEFSNWDYNTAKNKMYATTWLTAEDAVNAGFVEPENVTEPVKMAANANLSELLSYRGFKNVPKNIAERISGKKDNSFISKISNMAKELNPASMLESLVVNLEKAGFKMNGPSKDVKKNETALASVLKKVLAEQSSEAAPKGMVKIKAYDANGKEITAFAKPVKAQEQPAKKEDGGEEENTESGDGEENTEEEENEEEENTESGDGGNDAKDKGVKNQLKELKSLVQKMMGKKAGAGQGNGDEPKDDTISAADIIMGKVKPNRNGAGLNADAINKAAAAIAKKIGR